MSVLIGSTPNTTEGDLVIARGILDGSVKTEGSLSILQSFFNAKYDLSDTYFFNRGREAIYFLLQNLNPKPNDEVILQGFTCIAVVSPIIWSGCTPVYVDIKRDTFNMDLEKLEGMITEKTRAIIIQHTFGNIADMKKARDIVEKVNRGREKKIFLLEDSAHILDFDNKEIGKYSDAFLFSFAQDKSVSSTQGSVLVVNKRELLDQNLTKKYEEVPTLTKNEALYNARYILLWDKIKRGYFRTVFSSRITVGKILLVWYRLLGKIRKQASSGTVNFEGIHKMSEVQAKLLLTQLESLEKFNINRRRISKIYGREDVLLRYPILVENPSEVKERLREIGVIPGTWYSTPIFPIPWNNLECLGYKMGHCPEVEFCSKHIINLPTNIEVDQEKAKEIMNVINNHAKRI